MKMRGSLPVVKVYYRYSIAPVNSFSGFVSMRPQRFYSVSSSSRSSRSDDVFKITNHLVEKTPITAQLWNMRRNANTTPLTLQDSHNHNTNGITTNEADAMTLQTKIPIDSQVIIHYNFTQDDHLRDMYADHTGGILIGKLFEDLDALAGNIAHSHCDSTKRNLALVTASVDRIIQTKYIPITCDMMLIGRVVWVGTSSLDIMIEIQSTGDSASESLFSCFFTYVARSKSTNRAAPVNKLELNTEIEKKLFQTRQELADQRKKASSNIHSDYSNIQSEITKLLEAGNAVEDMPALAHPNAVLMKSTVLENSLVCQPQNTNTSGRVFGGFLMHRAYDLAVASCYTFAGAHPVFREVDQIMFKRPVDIGDLVRLKSRVTFSGSTSTSTSSASGASDKVESAVCVEVNCQVIRPEKASSFVSNTFQFQFAFEKPMQLRQILPSTVEEATKIHHVSTSLRTPN